MDFDSPEERKNFPGLYSSENRKATDDYNNDSEKINKKEMITKRKDRKDKDKGYAALEGESSGDESPCKPKKSKAFKFSKSKAKDKGDTSGSKYKIKKKAAPQKAPKKKTDCEIHRDLAGELPIFGCTLKDACQRGKCHDGISIPLPVRECIDFVEDRGKILENVYKTSGNKPKAQLIKKNYDNRQPVSLYEYEVPTVTSVLKLFFRELSDPLLTNELSAKFEEAASMIHCRSKVMRFQELVMSLPSENRLVLGWVIVHFSNIVEMEQINKMTVQNLAQAMHQSLRMPAKVLCALISFKCYLFKKVEIIKYYPPLKSGMPYPEDPEKIAKELLKLESALDLIHWEMQNNYSSNKRQDQLWELQRIQTELKRKQKKTAKQTNTQEDAPAQQMQETQESVSGSEPQSSMGAEVERLLTGSGGLPPMQHSDRPTDVRRLFSEDYSDEDLVMEEESETEDEPDRETAGWRQEEPEEREASEHERGVAGWCKEEPEEREASENERGTAGPCQEEPEKHETSENDSEDADEQELDDKESDDELQTHLDKSIAGSSTIPSEIQCAQSCSPNAGSTFKANFCVQTIAVSSEHCDSSASARLKQNKLVWEVLQSGKALLHDKFDHLNLAQIEQVSDDTSVFLEAYTGLEMLVEQFKNQLLKDFKNKLMLTIHEANLENSQIENKCQNHCWYVYAKAKKSADHFEKVLDLLQKENHMLLVNKIELIRKIMEDQEECLKMEATLKVINMLEKKD